MVNTVGESSVGLVVVVETCSEGSVVAVTFTVAVVPAAPVPPAADAVTVASRLVVSVVCAVPDGDELTSVADRAPVSLENATGTPPIGLLLVSSTVAVMVDEPPEAGT